jgi:predicted AlkP superfamily pyrophosphatase or phosphodiesterase
MAKPKLLLIMIDGVSADYFESFRDRMPNLSALAASGYRVGRMASAVPGTSMPGRASILTGVDAATHGIYGNRVLDGGVFVGAEVEHLRVPTFATLAARAGMDVACIGHALIAPEDTTLYVPPCWLRGPGFTKVPGDGSISTLLKVKDPDHRLASVPLPSYLPQTSKPDRIASITGMLIGDQLTIGAAASLLQSLRAPDLLITEIDITDTSQHNFGVASDEAHFAMAIADSLVGVCLDSLRRTNRLDDYAICIVSDHGHGNIEKSILPDLIIPGRTWQSEGATMHVLVEDDGDRQQVTDKLVQYGAEPWSSDHLPSELRGRIATFVAPTGHDFEQVPAGHSTPEPIGIPRYKSTHGFRPGMSDDDRLCIFSGAGIPQGALAKAEATRLAPTIAAVLGLSLDIFPDRPLFESQPS